MVSSPRKQCSVPECTVSVRTRGYCNVHYQRWYRHGDPLGGAPIVPTDLWERFLTHVTVVESGCWIWTAWKDRDGYGGFKVDRKMRRAHAWAHEYKFGKAPKGLVYDHFVCDNPSCVNPNHVRPTTNAVNVLRGTSFAAQNARKTHCVNGHEFNAVNTYLGVRNSRVFRACRTCLRARTRQYRAISNSNPTR